MPSGVVVGGGGPPRPRPPPPPNRFQIPEKSTLPSAVLGAGPSSTGFPSLRGTSGVGNDGHCASSGGANATQRARAPPNIFQRVIQKPTLMRKFFSEAGSRKPEAA